MMTVTVPLLLKLVQPAEHESVPAQGQIHSPTGMLLINLQLIGDHCFMASGAMRLLIGSWQAVCINCSWSAMWMLVSSCSESLQMNSCC